MRTEPHPGITLDGVTHDLVPVDGGWQLMLPRAVVPVRDPAELGLLEHAHDTLVTCRVACDEDVVTLLLTPAADAADWSRVQRLPRADRLRALVAAAACTRLVERGYTTVLAPENLVVDRHLGARVLYRGLLGVMPPVRLDPRDVLAQYQALVLCTLDPRQSYAVLVAGAARLRRGTAFERAVTGAASVDELVAVLAEAHDATAEEDAARLVRVGRRSHRAFRHATAWLGVVAIGAGAFAAHDAFVRAPFDARMLEADARFIARDFEGVIETLRPVAADALPTTQRYVLASAYLRGSGLHDDQRAAIENNLSPSSDRDFLTYWVLVGRGDLEDALDLAKGQNDVDLVLYALTLLEEQVGADTSLSGTERQERLTALRAEYDTALASRTSAIDEGAEALAGTGAADLDPEAADDDLSTEG